jgi:membrane associated rhomboid family serine protease
VFPIGDENHAIRLRPFVTWALIAINIVVFLYQLSFTERELARYYFDWGTIPLEISRGDDLLTLLTSMFLHGGWLHIAGNMLFLWVFGDNVEDTMGHLSFLLFYGLCGLGASGLQVLVDQDSRVPMIGASGAISGVLAAYLVLYPHGRIRTILLIGFAFVVMVPAWAMIGYWIVLQFINGFASLGVNTAETGGGVAYFAHIGGFIAGAALVWLFRDKEIQERHQAMREGSRGFERTGPLRR